PPPEALDRLAPAAEEAGQVDHERELGEFHRLKRHAPQAQPAPGAVDRLPERRHQHEHQEEGGHAEERQRDPLEHPVVHRERRPQPAQAQQRPEELALEEVVRVAEAIGGEDRARRVHHHHADRDEHQRRAEEPHVGDEPPRHQCSGSARTRARKTSPRCSKLSNMSKDAHAGERRTTWPGAASPRAVRTAASKLAAAVTATPAAWSACPTFSPSSPISTAWATRPRATWARGPKSCPLPLPPAISTIGSPKLSRALIVEATLVPFESLKNATPPMSRTNSMRWGTPRKTPMPRRIAAGAMAVQSAPASAANVLRTSTKTRVSYSTTATRWRNASSAQSRTLEVSDPTVPSTGKVSARAARAGPMSPPISTASACCRRSAPSSAVIV